MKPAIITALCFACIAFGVAFVPVCERLDKHFSPSRAGASFPQADAPAQLTFESDTIMIANRWLSNIPDPYRALAEQSHTYSFEAMQSGYESMHEEWNQYMKWVRSNVIGPAKDTEKYTQNELGAMGIVGLYSPELPAQLYRVTAYCPCEKCCGKFADGITASGKPAVGKIVAAPSTIPFGTVLAIPGYSEVAVVWDRGGAITGNRLDVLFPTHERAKQWGVQELMVREVK